MGFGLSGARLRRAITSLKRHAPSVFPLCALRAGFARHKRYGLRPLFLLRAPPANDFMFTWAGRFGSRSRPAPAVLVLVASGALPPNPFLSACACVGQSRLDIVQTYSQKPTKAATATTIKFCIVIP